MIQSAPSKLVVTHHSRACFPRQLSNVIGYFAAESSDEPCEMYGDGMFFDVKDQGLRIYFC